MIEYSHVFRSTRFKTPQGAEGLFFTMPGWTNVTVKDSQGRGLKNVQLIAQNAGGDSPSFTDEQGGAFMQIDDNATVVLIKDSLSKEVVFPGGEVLLIEIDLPILPY